MVKHSSFQQKKRKTSQISGNLSSVHDVNKIKDTHEYGFAVTA
jgi:hypothetical protein